MCRNTRTLHDLAPETTHDEVHAAALQHVRTVAGTTRPSRADQDAVDHAVAEIAHATEHLLQALTTTAPPGDREVLARRTGGARARSAQRCSTPVASTAVPTAPLDAVTS